MPLLLLYISQLNALSNNINHIEMVLERWDRLFALSLLSKQTPISASTLALETSKQTSLTYIVCK